MAFGKKDTPAPAAEALVPAEAAEEAPLEELGEAEADTDAGMMASLAPDPEPESSPEAGGTDALLDMFSTVGIEVVDRTLLTDLAGEVEMTDLISELNIVAAALGIVMGEHAARGEQDAPAEEMLAA
jgi:hypothetical protein